MFSLATLIRKAIKNYPTFVSWYKEKTSSWYSVLSFWGNKFLDLLEYLIFFRTICRFFFKKIKDSYAWYRRPRVLEDRVILAAKFVLFFVVFLLVMYIWFCQWRWWSRVYHWTELTIQHPYYVITPNGTYRYVNLLDYLYNIERFAEYYGYYDPSVPDHSTGFWETITERNKKFFGWRPTWVGWKELIGEYKRMKYYHLNFEKPDWRVYYMPMIFNWVCGLELWQPVFEDEFFRTFILPNPEYHLDPNFYPTLYRMCVDAWRCAMDTWYMDVHIKNIPWYIITAFPDEWYMRHEDDGFYDDFMAEVFGELNEFYHYYFVKPHLTYVAEMKYYRKVIKPPLPDWGPGRLVIRDCIIDIYEVFCDRYLSVKAISRVLSRRIDPITVYNKVGYPIATLITYVYGIPFLLISYFVALYSLYCGIPLKAATIGAVFSSISNFFLSYKDSIEILASLFYYFFLLDEDASVIPYERPLSHFYSFFQDSWMLFTIFPYLNVLVVLPFILAFGILQVVLKPFRLLYHLIMDHRTGDLRTFKEIKEIVADQLVVFREGYGFLAFRYYAYLKSFLMRAPYHVPPIRLLPRRYRRPGIKSTYKWKNWTGILSGEWYMREYHEHKADMTYIKNHGEEAFEKLLDERFWMDQEKYEREYVEAQCITPENVAHPQVFVVFLLVGHIVISCVAIMGFISISYKKLLFAHLFSDAVFANGLTPFSLGAAAHPKDRKAGNPGWDDDRDEEWEPYTDLIEPFYVAYPPGTFIDHYAEVIFVVYKWFFLHSVFFVICFILALYFFKSLRGALVPYIGEMLLAFATYLLAMGWSAYAFSGGFPEIDLLGLRGPLNLLMVGEEWLFDNYLTGLFTIDLELARLEQYFDSDVKFRVEWRRYRRHHKYHINRYWGVYMHMWEGMKDLNPWRHFLESYRYREFKAFLTKYEPKLKEWREYFWGEEENYDNLDDEDSTVEKKTEDKDKNKDKLEVKKKDEANKKLSK